MTDQTANLPVFLTRSDVANLLRLSPRQVDRLATAGVLMKQKLSASRSGFERSGVESYLRTMKGSTASTPPSAFTDFTMAGGEYGSRGIMLLVDVDGDAALVGAALDDWLPKNGVRGCMIIAGDGRVGIMWAHNLGLSPDTVRAAIERVKATAVHARSA